MPCEKPGAGYGVTPNCGYDDDGGTHEHPSEKCGNQTFNNGDGYFCRPCSRCVEGVIKQPCTDKTDTVCSTERQTATVSPETFVGDTPSSALSWALPLLVVILISLLVLCYIIYRKKGFRRPSCSDAHFTPLHTIQENTQFNNIFRPDVLAAPLMCVLDDLDVLEELIILLDPEPQGRKSTKHLASLCNFSSSWVTYTYSLKESKSPLKAVLEGVTSRHPDWTVGHLAELLRQMERMDAVMVLSKIRLDKVIMVDV